MAHGPLGVVTNYLLSATAALEGKSDAELLRLYAVVHDCDAFALLVHRHGPLVLGVCRRILGFTADADDAFQATFLALARSAKNVRECVPGWLHRVAVRTSRKAAAKDSGADARHGRRRRSLRGRRVARRSPRAR